MERKNIPDPGFAGDAMSLVFSPLRPPGPMSVSPSTATIGTSRRAVATLHLPDGRRGLPAFTGLDALARWRPDARPAPVPACQAVEAAWHAGAETLLIDRTLRRRPARGRRTPSPSASAARPRDRRGPVRDPGPPSRREPRPSAAGRR
ncbi:hypothetical protein GTY41_35250 [Streptomyces sp. SID685]|nr:hypothetical protein [Streptomyces sp. SID685]